jgi:hypothetical protein
MTIYEKHEMPENRTPESFAYHVQYLWGGFPVDEYWTDEPEERDELVRSGHKQEYVVQVRFHYSL